MTTSMTNPQYDNVGNLGDILKHAALVNLLDGAMLAWHADAVYVDTHAFRAFAPLPQPLRWRRELRRLSDDGTNAYYGVYRGVEEAGLGSDGFYRCSCGIAAESIFRFMMEPDDRSYPRILASERHVPTRRLLAQQLKGMTVPHRLYGDAWELLRTDLPEHAHGALALVDPFTSPLRHRELYAETFDRWARGRDLVVLLFAHDRQVAAFPWPATWGPTGLQARIDRAPYHLAVYTADENDLAAGCACILAGLDWDVTTWR